MITCDNAVDVYNPKAVRASAGALFSVPVARDVPIEALFEALHVRGVPAVGLAAGATQSIDDADLAGPVAIVVGNEAHGLSDVVRAHLSTEMSIPLLGDLESLNAGSAMTVSVFETARRRRSG